MNRAIPGEFTAAPADLPRPSSSTLTLDIRLATPILAGGPEAGILDPLTPFRVPSIRGALRHAWRMTRGGQFTTAEELRSQESAIWGATDHASPVKIQVLNANPGTAFPAAKSDGQRVIKESPDYALFPAQSKPFKDLHRGGSFRLQITIESSKSPSTNLIEHVDAALRAWINFGGLGARTRRGLGALYCREYSGLDRWYNPADILGDGKTRPWPTLKGARLLKGNNPMPWEQAWIAAIDILREYRQQRFRPQGRSRWPEPDAIRRLRHQRDPRHSEDLRHDDAFPRSAFGLPIIFHFKSKTDPADNELRIDEETDRMASPVILKPLAIDERNAVPLCLILNAPPPPSLALRQKNTPDLSVSPGSYRVLDQFAGWVAAQWKTQAYTL